MDVKPTNFKKYDATYSVSPDGYCIRSDTGFFMRCVSSDSREPFYQFAVGGCKKRVSVRLAVSTAHNLLIKITDERAAEMRRNADLWNSEERPGGKRKYNYSEKRKWKKPKPSTVNMYGCEPFDDPFPDLLTYVPGLPSWDCAEMDPMGCGTWPKVMLQFETEERRAIAA